MERGVDREVEREGTIGSEEIWEKRVGWREGRRELGGRGKRGEDSGERGEIIVGGERL